MVAERSGGTGSLIEVLDRVLDKGVVVDAWVRVSLIGIDLLTVEARVLVASIATSLQYSDTVMQRASISGEAAMAPRRLARTRRRPALASSTTSTPGAGLPK